MKSLAIVCVIIFGLCALAQAIPLVMLDRRLREIDWEEWRRCRAADSRQAGAYCGIFQLIVSGRWQRYRDPIIKQWAYIHWAVSLAAVTTFFCLLFILSR